MPEFQHIEYLILLALVPALIGIFIYALYKKRMTVKKLGDKELVNLLTSNHSSSAYLQKFLLVVLAFGILIMALANLRSTTGSEKISRNGIDVMIALDVSKSMLAQDIKPTRLDRAKQLLSRLVDKLSNDRVGIVVFAGKAYLQMPLTGDHAATKMYLNAANTESVPTQGTVIGDALKACNASFNTKEKKYKAVILISDGEDHDEGAMKTASEMGQDGIMIYTVGIGSPQGSPLIDEATNQLKTDKDGNTVISKLNEEELRSIADKGNGKYILFQNTDDVVENIKSELAGMDQRNVTDDSLLNYKSYFMYFLAVAFLFLTIEIFISEKKKRKNDYLKLKPSLAILFVFIGLGAAAQTQKENLAIKKGNEAYMKNDYSNALDAYGKVIEKNPENATAQFNQGNALYKTDKKEAAVVAYDKALKKLNEPVEKSNAFYNKGVVFQNDKKLPECILAYKNALRLDPGNEDARQNLQKALQQQQQQQNKDQNKDQNKKKQDQKKNEEKKPEPKQQQSKLTRKDAEEKLKALMEQEKNLQDKLHKVNATSVSKPEKDW
ncbi:MAG: VWA domain-containing protein [Ferruginibacter sp.]